MEKQELNKIDGARKEIEKEVNDPGSYSHNIVGLTLSIVARAVDYETADAMIDELNLTEIFGIPKSGKSGRREVKCPPYHKEER